MDVHKHSPKYLDLHLLEKLLAQTFNSGGPKYKLQKHAAHASFYFCFIVYTSTLELSHKNPAKNIFKGFHGTIGPLMNCRWTGKGAKRKEEDVQQMAWGRELNRGQLH